VEASNSKIYVTSNIFSINESFSFSVDSESANISLGEYIYYWLSFGDGNYDG
jgi:hypothetical protein